jgi:hypothetical protein
MSTRFPEGTVIQDPQDQQAADEEAWEDREPQAGDRIEVDYELFAKLVNERDRFKDALEMIASEEVQSMNWYGVALAQRSHARLALNPITAE